MSKTVKCIRLYCETCGGERLVEAKYAGADIRCGSCGISKSPKPNRMLPTKPKPRPMATTSTTIKMPPSHINGQAPYARNDHIEKHFDWSIGQEVSSQSERDKIYKAKGLRRKSIAEYKREHPTNGPMNTTIDYGGKTRHRHRTGRVVE